MNHLAHCLLAAPDPALVAGGFAGDFFRGPLGRQPEALRAGIALHRRIDALSQEIAGFRSAAARFPAPARRAAPIVVDLITDHHLAAAWDAWHDEPLDAFARRVHEALDAHRPWLPEGARRQADAFRQHDVLPAYGDPEVPLRAARRVAERAGPALRARLLAAVVAMPELVPATRGDCLAGLRELWDRVRSVRNGSSPERP